MAENLVEKAIREADAACQAAIMETPLLYQSFITFLPQRKRIGGTRQQPIYANIRIPYMGVDGRVKWAKDEHKEAGSTITITTHFEEVFGKPMCKCIIMSPIYGTRTAWAEVKIGGTGVDETSPLENGESSAISRALRFMGYGLFGGDVTSAEEIMNQEYESTPVSPPDRPSLTAPASSDRVEAIEPASDKQLGFLYSLLKNYGIEEGHKRAFIEFIYPIGMGKRECSDHIETLKNRGQMPDEWQTYYLNFLVKRQGIDRQRIVDKMMAICRHSEPEKLTTSDFVLVTQALKTNAADAPAPTPVPAQDFSGLLKELSDACEISQAEMDNWVIAKFGGIHSAQEQTNVYEKLRAMDIDEIKGEIHGAKATA